MIIRRCRGAFLLSSHPSPSPPPKFQLPTARTLNVSFRSAPRRPVRRTPTPKCTGVLRGTNKGTSERTIGAQKYSISNFLLSPCYGHGCREFSGKTAVMRTEPYSWDNSSLFEVLNCPTMNHFCYSVLGNVSLIILSDLLITTSSAFSLKIPKGCRALSLYSSASRSPTCDVPGDSERTVPRVSACTMWTAAQAALRV